MPIDMELMRMPPARADIAQLNLDLRAVLRIAVTLASTDPTDAKARALLIEEARALNVRMNQHFEEMTGWTDDAES